jgi:uncharacterized protein (TIGR02996 family)
MSAIPVLRSLDEARRYAARAVCGGCQKAGTLAAFEVRKEGPNHGRLFTKCRHCGHFEWLSAAMAPDEELERAQAKATPCPRCGKGRRARRVRKEGPNQGRLFLVCDDPACDSFEWASPATHPPPEQARRPAPEPGPRTEEGLLADIRDNPDDDAPRLIYADWLDEHDQPLRAELIRVQVERDRLPAKDPARKRLEECSRAILAEGEEEWTAPLRPLVLSYRYVRGLIDDVEVEADRFAAHADELLRLAPTAAWCVLVGGWQEVRTVVGCKQLLRIRRLRLQAVDGWMGGAGARVLAESPHVANLKALSLDGKSLGQPGTQALAGSRYLANLEVLDLTSNNLARSAVPLLASSSNLPRLRRLVLADNHLGDSDVRALANSPHLKELRELDLSYNAVTNEGIDALACSPLLARLRRLNLKGCQVTKRAVARLRESPQASPDLVVTG